MRLLIFSGTTEGRELSRRLAGSGAEITVSVATEYGREEQGNIPGVRVLCGRKTEPEIIRLLQETDVCIDATHPYAVEVSRNIREACRSTGTVWRRLLRPRSAYPADSVFLQSAQEAAKWLADREGNVLLTTGAKELGCYRDLNPERLYPRVLPLEQSLVSCRKAGIPGRNIIAMQGPFSEALNEALLDQFQIRYLVTKDGGRAGGFQEKAEAARSRGVTLLLIARPEEEGSSMEELLDEVTALLAQEQKTAE